MWLKRTNVETIANNNETRLSAKRAGECIEYLSILDVKHNRSLNPNYDANASNINVYEAMTSMLAHTTGTPMLSGSSPSCPQKRAVRYEIGVELEMAKVIPRLSINECTTGIWNTKIMTIASTVIAFSGFHDPCLHDHSVTNSHLFVLLQSHQRWPYSPQSSVWVGSMARLSLGQKVHGHRISGLWIRASHIEQQRYHEHGSVNQIAARPSDLTKKKKKQKKKNHRILLAWSGLRKWRFLMKKYHHYFHLEH